MFITMEGPDGSGKSRQLAALVVFLRDQGHQVLATREPGGTAIGDQVRDILATLGNTSMQARTEILLFQASRAQLVDQVIMPGLKRGGIVVCDRYADSTLAYQGYGHRVDLEELRVIVNFATQGLKPDLTLLLDIDVSEGLKRKARGGEWNRLDAYDLEFHERVRQGYHKMASEEPERWEIIDGGGTIEQVQSAIRAVVVKRLKERQAG